MSRPDEPARSITGPSSRLVGLCGGGDEGRSHCHGRLEGAMRVVVLDQKVVDRVVEDGLRLTSELQRGQRALRTAELCPHLLEVVVVHVGVTAIPEDGAGLQPHLLRHHATQQRVARDVERHTEEHVRAALCHDDRELAASDVELELHVAGLQRHQVQVGHVPG